MRVYFSYGNHNIDDREYMEMVLGLKRRIKSLGHTIVSDYKAADAMIAIITKDALNVGMEIGEYADYRKHNNLQGYNTLMLYDKRAYSIPISGYTKIGRVLCEPKGYSGEETAYNAIVNFFEDLQ